jgi:uncharacterized protein (DUF885 family)
MTHITGKFQILRLLGQYRDHFGKQFSLKQFHNDLLGNGSSPLSVQAWLLLGDASDLGGAN